MRKTSNLLWKMPRLLTISIILLATKLNGQMTTSYGTNAGTLGQNNSTFGYEAGKNLTNTSSNNVFVGSYAGQNASGSNNTLVGYNSGKSNNTGPNNSFFGHKAGEATIYGDHNSFFGSLAGYNSNGSGPGTNKGNCFFGVSSGSNNTANFNSFYGAVAGSANTSGERNSFFGMEAGRENLTGSGNTYIGYMSGKNATGSGNIFIGNGAASFSNIYSNILFIENTDQQTPLIYGDFATDKVGINTTCIPNGYSLGVRGKIIAEEMKVQLSSSGCWPDYVFKPEYRLRPLAEVETHIKERGHLPEVPSALAIGKNEGYELGAMDATLLKKIEELTLYAIQMEKQVKSLQEENKMLKDDILPRLSKLEKHLK